MSFRISIPDHLIGTKFYPPRVRDRLVRRRQLLDRLNENADYRLTLVSAAAGYGKSTLAHQWLRESEAPYAWLSLDEYDNKLDLFADYLITALGSVYPEMGIEAGSLLRRAQLPDAERLVDGLLRDLQDLPRPVFLVLDDFHVIKDQEIMAFMNRLLKRMPANLHLVLLARIDPPLALAPMRGRGQLLELRGHDLRFTTEEAAALLKQIVGEPIDSETVQLLTERTEGWPAGLRMAAMSLRASGDPREFTSKYSEGGHKLVSDYLLGEVLNRLPDEDRLLLLRTSIVTRLCAPLIDVLAGDSIPGRDGYDFLEMLWSANFFLIALDGQGAWYRYHHLFRQLLEQQSMREFSKEEVDAMHRQVSYWFERAGFVEEAVFHSLQAGDGQRAALIVENHVHGPLNQENWRLTDRWIHLLPEEVRRRPGLLATQAMLEQIRYRVDMMTSLLDAAEEGIKSDEYDYAPAQEQAWTGVINAFRTVMWTPSATPEDSLRYAALALEQVRPEAKYVRSVAELGEVLALQMAGDGHGALHLVRRKLASRIGPPDAITHRLMIAQTYVFYCEADVRGTQSSSDTYLDMALNAGQRISISWLHYLRGWAFYQANRLEEAESDFRKLSYLRDSAHVRNVIDSITGLVLIYNARGEPEKAKKTIDDLHHFVIEQGAAYMLSIVDSIALRLDLDDTLSIYIPELTVEPEAQLAADLWELPVLTACRRAIISESEDHLELVEKNLAACYAFALSRNNKRQLLQIHALQSLLHEVKGQNQEALDCLKKAVSLGEAGGALRYFVDLGPKFIPLLRALHEQGFATVYIEKVFSAYGVLVQREDATKGASDGKPVALSSQAAATLDELTSREMEILLLLSERLTNKEIAARLHIAPSTVGKHAIRLYEKLGVSGRRQAAVRARELGILGGQ